MLNLVGCSQLQIFKRTEINFDSEVVSGTESTNNTFGAMLHNVVQSTLTEDNTNSRSPVTTRSLYRSHLQQKVKSEQYRKSIVIKDPRTHQTNKNKSENGIQIRQCPCALQVTVMSTILTLIYTALTTGDDDDATTRTRVTTMTHPPRPHPPHDDAMATRVMPSPLLSPTRNSTTSRSRPRQLFLPLDATMTMCPLPLLFLRCNDNLPRPRPPRMRRQTMTTTMRPHLRPPLT